MSWKQLRRTLRRVVRDRGATPTDIASAIGVTVGTVRKWLAGKAPGRTTQERLGKWALSELCTPGSVHARAEGCKCSSTKDVFGNHYGKGWGITHTQTRADKLWLVRTDCPLHGEGSGWRR